MRKCQNKSDHIKYIQYLKQETNTEIVFSTGMIHKRILVATW